jgi:hypothetical protein
LTIFGQVAIREPGRMGGFHLLDVFGLECVLSSSHVEKRAVWTSQSQIHRQDAFFRHSE